MTDIPARWCGFDLRGPSWKACEWPAACHRSRPALCRGQSLPVMGLGGCPAGVLRRAAGAGNPAVEEKANPAPHSAIPLVIPSQGPMGRPAVRPAGSADGTAGRGSAHHVDGCRKRSVARAAVKSSAVTPDGNDATPGEPNPGPGRRAPEPGGLTARTVPIADPGDLLARIPPASPPASALAWVRQGSGLVGWGEVARITLPAGEDRFTAGEKWLRTLFEGAVTEDRVRRPGTGPVAFASFTFDPASDGSVLIVPRTILGRDPSGQAWLTTISDGREPGRSGERRDGDESRGHGPGDSHDAAAPACPGAPAGFGAPANPGDLADAGAASPGLRWHDGSLTALEWAHAVAVAVSRISAGALRKVVLARDVFATAAGPIDARVRAAPAGRPVPGLLHVLVREPGRRYPRTSGPAAGQRGHGADPGRDLAPGRPARRRRRARRRPARLGQEHRGARLRGRLGAGRARAAVRRARHSVPPLAAQAGQRAPPGHLRPGHSRPGPFGAVAGRSAAPTRRGVRDAGRNGAGTDPRTGAHGAGPVRRAGRLGGRARQRGVRDRAALCRTGRPPGPAVRRLRHRGGLGPGRRGGRDRGQVPPDAPVTPRLSVPGHPVSLACRGATVPARGHALAPGPGPGVSAASGGWPGRPRPRPGAGRRGPGCRPGRSRSC